MADPVRDNNTVTGTHVIKYTIWWINKFETGTQFFAEVAENEIVEPWAWQTECGRRVLKTSYFPNRLSLFFRWLATSIIKAIRPHAAFRFPNIIKRIRRSIFNIVVSTRPHFLCRSKSYRNRLRGPNLNIDKEPNCFFVVPLSATPSNLLLPLFVDKLLTK